MRNNKMRKIIVAMTLSFVFAALLVMSAQATTRTLTVYDEDAGIYVDKAYSKFCYTVDSEAKTATVFGNPEGVAPEDGSENTFAYGNAATTAIVPELVKVGSSTYTVTAVADDGFANHTSLERIVFESEVEIGERAFMGCQALANVDLGDEVTYIGDGAFSYCALEEIAIPASVTYIGNNAFYYNPALATVEGMDNVGITEIGSGAFGETEWIDGLSDEFVILGNGILVKYNGEAEAIEIPENVVGVSDAFAGMATITSIDFSKAEGLEFIANNAFYGCSGIVELDIPDTVKHIGDFAFSGCYALESVKIGAGVETIGFCAFSGCDAMTSFESSSEVLTSIGQCAFWNCSALKSIEFASLPDTLSLGFLWGTGLEKYEIPASIKTIDKAAFAATSGLEVLVPRSVENIMADAFAGANVTVVCAPDSAAASFGKQNFADDDTKKLVLFGDVNADGVVDVSDVKYFVKSFAGNAEAIIDNACAGDVEYDGNVTLKDLSKLVKYLAGASGVLLGK